MKRTQALAASFLSLSAFPQFADAQPPYVDSTDVRISTSVEHESAGFVSPLNANVILVVNNPGSTAWISTDGGLTWSSNSPFPGTGDPGASIIGDASLGPYGRFLVVGLFGPGATKVGGYYKSSPAAEWTSVAVTEDGPTDKSHVWVDNSAASGQQFSAYAAWIFGWPGPVVVGRSTDKAETWPDRATITHVPGAGHLWSPNLHTGRTGRVYLVWARRSGSIVDTGATTGFGFSERSQISPLAFHPETVLLAGNVHEVNDAVPSHAPTIPSMAVDRSDPTQDRLFVVWADDTTDGPEILMMKGTAALPNGPVDWDSTNVVRVNQNDSPAADQWWPYVAWDECTGVLSVVYVESIGSSVNTRVASSEDHGATWTDVRVSDASWNGAQQNAYDYIGIASGGGRTFPFWSDPRDGSLKAYTSRLSLWGVTSVSHTILAWLPGNIVRFKVTWTTNVRAEAADALVVTPPAGVPLGSVSGYSISADGKTHSAIYEGPCEPKAPGVYYSCVVSSRSSCAIGVRTSSYSLQIPYCVE